MKIILIIAFGILLSACDSRPTHIFKFDDDQAREKVIADLEEKEIWYQDAFEGRIIVLQDDMSLVLQLASKATEEIIPLGRSISVNKHMQKAILKRLDEAGIKYHIVNYGQNHLPPNADELGFSSEFIVFKAGQEAKGFEIIDNFQDEINPDDNPEYFGPQQEVILIPDSW